LQELCEDAGEIGFGAEEFIRAGNLFLVPAEKQCDGYVYSEPETDYDEEDYWDYYHLGDGSDSEDDEESSEDESESDGE
jgi:hypothetical protein